MVKMLSVFMHMEPFAGLTCFMLIAGWILNATIV